MATEWFLILLGSAVLVAALVWAVFWTGLMVYVVWDFIKWNRSKRQS